MIRIAGWAFLALTVLATVYFGWHYIADDVAGAIIGWAAVSVGAWATGNRGRRKRRLAEELDEVQPAAPSQEPSAPPEVVVAGHQEIAGKGGR
jgi:membrane-associated phospholipid phosphatase